MMDFNPANNKIPITIQLMNEGFAILRILTPTNEPNIIPTNEGTTISGIIAPLFRYIHAADVSVIDSKNFEVATLTFIGAPINRLRTGTFAQPAPSPNIPAINPIMIKLKSPDHVRCIFHEISRFILGSLYMPVI